MTRGEYWWPLHIYNSNSQHSHYLNLHFAHILGLKQSSCESEDRIFSILIGRKTKKKKKQTNTTKQKQSRILFDISFITFFSVNFALKNLTHFKSILKQLSFCFYTRATKSLSWTFLSNNSYSLLIHRKCHLLPQAYYAFAQSLFSTRTCTMVATLNFLPLFCLIRCACSRYAVRVRSTLCLFEIPCVWSGYTLPGSQYALPFRGMRCLFPLRWLVFPCACCYYKINFDPNPKL